ncbi:MAG: hypothetical protein IKC59_07865 [Clostridia bacterium]|nr:hypothetical protein [Clostridia bacterium]
MKKVFALFLSVLFICLAFAGCGEKDPGSTDNQPPVTQPPADNEMDYELAVKDLEEREMTILMPEGRIKQFAEDTENPDALNEGIVKRNQQVEQTMNCVLYYNNVPLNAELMSNIMTSEMLNQTGDFDIVFYEYWWNQEIHGYFYNLLESDVIAIEQPFYNKGWNDAATVKGTLNSLAGYGSIELMQRTSVTAFNKNMYNSLFTDSLYSYVDSGDWTLETMEEMAKAAHIDSGNDGVIEAAGERYGMVYDLWGGRAMLFTMGGTCTVKDDEGIPTVSFATESNLNILEQMQRLYNENYVNFNRDDAATAFSQNQALFSMTVFGTVETIRKTASGVNYGLVPFPKFNTAQQNYISTNTGTSTWSIPITAESKDDSAYLLNAFHYYSYQHVKPAYFDTVLKSQIAGDPDSARMIDLVMDTIYVDFAFVQDANLSNGVVNDIGQSVSVCNGSFEIIRGKISKDFTSFYSGVKEVYEANLAEFIERYVNGSGSAA